MDEKLYTCVCGKEFTNSQSFNSHKSLCKEHYIQKYGSLVEYEAQLEKRHKAATESLRKKADDKKQAVLLAWIDEQHTCERCGKVMTEKFGSGRFCSRFCANSRDHSDETKDKIRQALVKPEELKKKRVRQKAEPKERKLDFCLICQKPLKPGHLTPYCAEHLVQHRQEERIANWLETGDIGLNPDCTVGPVFRKYILEEQNNCCAICGMQPVWNNKALVFILDHIDGDAAHSERSNLRLICPNCDSQLPTYKSKNKNSSRTKRKNFLKTVRDSAKDIV